MDNSPKYHYKKFICPNCNTLSQQEWFDKGLVKDVTYKILYHFFYNYRTSIDGYFQTAIKAFLEKSENFFRKNITSIIPEKLSIATCSSCNDITIWVDQKLVFPQMINVPKPNSDLNDDIKELYFEAAKILYDSPKGSTALLRLCLQNLLKQIGKKGKNINNDIKELVAEGLSPKIQQALDLLRVIGNNAVHPGQINIDDNKEVAIKLFNILNFIADEMITKPKELESLYENLIPEDTKNHIVSRDK